MENNERINDVLSGRGASEKIMRLPPVSTAADFILPDYMGDVKKMLNYSARIVPSGKFIGSESASFAGIVCYSVIYIDNENRLTEAAFTSDYEYECRVIEDIVDATTQCELTALSVRLQGPRKISARSTLLSEVIFAEQRAPELPRGAEELELLEKTLSEKTIQIYSLGEREYAEEAARLEGVRADDVSVIYSGGEFIPGSAECRDGRLTVTGEIALYAVLLIDEEMTLRVEKNIPVEESIEVDDCSYTDSIVDGVLTSFRVSVNNCRDASDEGGEDCASVAFNASMEYTARVSSNRSEPVVADAFSCSRDCECEYKTYTYNEHLGTVKDKKMVELEVDKGELETSDVTDILSTEAAVKLIDCKLEGNRMLYEAELTTVTLVQTSKEPGYAALKCSSHISDSLKLGTEYTEGVSVKAALSVSEAKARHDGSSLCVKCFISVLADIKQEKHQKIVASVSLSDNELDGSVRPGITVFYPEETDTLWSVAKKYRVSVAKLAEENMLDSKCLAEGAESSVANVDCLTLSRGIR